MKARDNFLKKVKMVVKGQVNINEIVLKGSDSRSKQDLELLAAYLSYKVEFFKNDSFQDQEFMRPEELKYLKGDSNKVRKELGWKPEYTFELLMDEMIEHWDEQVRITKMISNKKY